MAPKDSHSGGSSTGTMKCDVCRSLHEALNATNLLRPSKIKRHEVGTELQYDITSLVDPNLRATARLKVEKFVGGGFAGQVYQVALKRLEGVDSFPGLTVGQKYALKILIPPSGFSRLFRNTLYWIGFQGPFQLQVNPSAARAGALWQKFIRRAARMRFGEDSSVVDIHATLVDEALGSAGEISEWIDGRTWRLELDDRMDELRRWMQGRPVDETQLGSPEFRNKRVFMQKFVALLHEMGAHEFARQYEWCTWKSQPNCLKRRAFDDDPMKGLTAVDFRAGLTLLPFLPMSPGDFKLIAQGLSRGDFVQFDRGDLAKLESFVGAHSADFGDMRLMLEELKVCEDVYRHSVPDVTHHGVRLLYSGKLWATMRRSSIVGWKTTNLIDPSMEESLKKNSFKWTIFTVLGFIPLVGRVMRKFWARTDWRHHYVSMLKSPAYFNRAIRAKMIELLIDWNRDGRTSDSRTLELLNHPWRMAWNLPLSIMPAGLHRIFTDFDYARDRLTYLIVRPIRLYFSAKLREEWLMEMVRTGRKRNLLTEDDERVIVAQIQEPFIQKYLKSLAVHVCMFPMTHVVALICAIAFVVLHPEMPRAEAWAIGLGIIALFQVIPISPGSLCRGIYVVYLVVKERNLKDYTIALCLSFFKYIGYLAFPIQMTRRYPTLARFMAGLYATEMVHAVPVFGEGGALLEHKVFCLFYNWPLTIQRRMKARYERLTAGPARSWHAVLGAVCCALIVAYGDRHHIPMRVLALVLAPLFGAGVAYFAGGITLSRRILLTAVCGVAVGLVYIVLAYLAPGNPAISEILMTGFWGVFIFGVLAPVGAIVAELLSA